MSIKSVQSQPGDIHVTDTMIGREGDGRDGDGREGDGRGDQTLTDTETHTYIISPLPTTPPYTYIYVCTSCTDYI